MARPGRLTRGGARSGGRRRHRGRRVPRRGRRALPVARVRRRLPAAGLTTGDANGPSRRAAPLGLRPMRPMRIVIVGGGPAGYEAALVAAEHGADVTVVTREGLGGNSVLFGSGQVPFSRQLGLESAGVQLDDDGAIPVDGVSRTNVHTVYAAGDVTGRVMLASVAAMQGRNAMWHALGEAVAPIRWDAVAACIFTDPEVAAVGMSAEDVAAAHIPVTTVTLPWAGNPRAKMAEDTDGFVKLHVLEGSGTVLGGSVVAARASDLIHPITLAVHNRLSVTQVAQAFSIYPSMSGSIQEAARMAMSRLAQS